jgi:hypothetical protein
MSPTDPRHGEYAGAVAHWMEGERPCEPYAKAETRYRKMRKLRHLRGDPPMVPAIGFVRRYEALHAIGYTGPQIAEEAGLSVNALRSVRYHGCDNVRSETFQRLADAFERLCMDRPEGKYANRARAMAVRRGWAPPLAWDDIDDPDATPNLGIVKKENPGRVITRTALIEDAEWLADGGMTLTNILERLGCTRDNFEAACRRDGRRDLYRRLAERDPVIGEMSIAVRATLAAKRKKVA